MISQDKKDFIDSELEKYFSQYVPSKGKADTVGGELVRAMSRIIYRWWNDGDMIGVGYGCTTCNPSYRFIIDKIDISSRKLQQLYDGNGYFNLSNDEYDEAIYRLANAVLNYLDEYGTTVFNLTNTVDSVVPNEEDKEKEREWEREQEEEEEEGW